MKIFFIAIFVLFSSFIEDAFAAFGRFGGYVQIKRADGSSKEIDKNNSILEVGYEPIIDKTRDIGEHTVDSRSGVIYSAEQKYALEPVNLDEESLKDYRFVEEEKEIKPNFVNPSEGLNIIESGDFLN